MGRYMGRSIASSSTYLLAVLEDALLVGDAALGARGVVLPLATLHVDVHVQLPAEHGHLGLGQQAHGHVGRHLEGGDGGGRGWRQRVSDHICRQLPGGGDGGRERVRQTD